MQSFTMHGPFFSRNKLDALRLRSRISRNKRIRDDAHTLSLSLPKANPMGPAVRVRVTVHSVRQMDVANIVAGDALAIINGMVRARALVDDSPDWVEIEYRQQRCARGQEKTIVEVG